MPITKSRKSENDSSYRMSDVRRLSPQAKLIFALVKKSPQKRDDLCQSAGISTATFYRNLRVLKKRGIMKETPKGYVLWNYREQESLWNSLLNILENVGGRLVEAKIQGASYCGRDTETGWRQFAYDEASRTSGVVVLKDAPRLLGAIRSFGISIRDDNDGVFLTIGEIGWKDRLWWRSGLFEVEGVEERFDGYDVGFRVGKLVKVAFSKEGASITTPVKKVSDAQSLTRTRLIAHLNGDNITKDNGLERAAYCVMFADPNYDILQEFRSLTDPSDGIYAIGESETGQLIDADRTVYGYDEHVPITVYAADKEGISGAKVKRKMEVELRRVCEQAFPKDQHYGNLERRGDQRKVSNGLVLYLTEFIWNFSRTTHS